MYFGVCDARLLLRAIKDKCDEIESLVERDANCNDVRGRLEEMDN